LHPGATRGTGIDRYSTSRLSQRLARLFMKSPAQGAATQALLAGSPQVAGITGEYWSDCRIAKGNPLLADEGLRRRLWETSECIVSSIRAARTNAGMGQFVEPPPLRRVRRTADFVGL